MHLTEILIREYRMFIKILIAIKNLLRHAMNHKDVSLHAVPIAVVQHMQHAAMYTMKQSTLFFFRGGVQLNLYTQTMLI